MTYEFKNVSYVKKTANSRFWTYEQLHLFSTIFNSGNITVVESLRLMKTSYDSFVEKGVQGKTIFGLKKRWPEKEDPTEDIIYFTDADYKLGRVLTLIASALDDRTTSATRDQSSGSSNNSNANKGTTSNTTSENENKDQQNAFKQLSELRVTLQQILNDPKLQWDRERAEANLSMVWKETNP